MKPIYTHYKNGVQYQVIDYCQLQQNGEWVDAYIYVQFPEIKGICSQKYVRAVKEFNEKFSLTPQESELNDSCSFLDVLRAEQLSKILGKYKLW